MSFVVTVQTVPRSTSVAVTSAPVIGAPLGSVIVPTMDAVTSWPNAICVRPEKATSMEKKIASQSGPRLLIQNLRENFCFCLYKQRLRMLYSRWTTLVKQKLRTKTKYFDETA